MTFYEQSFFGAVEFKFFLSIMGLALESASSRVSTASIISSNNDKIASSSLKYHKCKIMVSQVAKEM